MKYSLHNIVSISYLKKADEIYIPYKDRRAIPDYAKKYPKTALVLEVPPATQWEFDELKEYYILSRERLTLCLPDMLDPRIEQIKSAGIPFFWGYTITSFYELQTLVNFGVSQARIGAPIFFDTDALKKFNITKRVIANVAHEGYIPGADGIVGSWIRPEDVDQYEGAIDILEFADSKSHKEEALYRIYAEQHAWPGKVDMIITNIDAPLAYNRMLPPEFTTARLNCRQRCMSGGACQLCHRYIKLADPELIKNYMETIQNN